MKKALKKLSSIFLALALAVSLMPLTAATSLADETETEAPAAASEKETEAPKETEKPKAETPKETEKPAAEAPKETEKPAAEVPEETEKPAAETPKNTEKPAEDDKAEADEPAATEKPAADTPEETEAPAEEGKGDADKPAETEKPAADTPEETEKSADESKPVETEKPAENKPETDTPAETEPAGNSDADTSKDAKINPGTIKNVKLEKGVMTWDAVSGATQYDIRVDYSKARTARSNQYNLGNLINQMIRIREIEKNYDDEYYVAISAYNKDGIILANWEDTLVYTTSVEFQLGTVKYNVDKGVLSWTKVSGATAYEVQIEDYYDWLTTNSLKLNAEIDRLIESNEIEKSNTNKYNITIYAYNLNGEEIAETSFTHSYKSSAKQVKPVEITNVKLASNGVLTWNKCAGATNYYLTLGSAWGQTVDTTTFNIGKVIDTLISEDAIEKDTEYWIGITAYNDKNVLVGSWEGSKAYSSKASYNPGKVTGIKVASNGVMTWNAYNGANAYWLLINDIYMTKEIKDTKINLNNAIDYMIKLGDVSKSTNGKYTVTVEADNKNNTAIAKGSITYTYDSKAKEITIGNITGVVFDDNGTVAWKDYPNAAKYEVSINDVCTTTVKTKFEINSKINQLVKAGTIEKSSPYSIYIFAYDKDGIYLAEWYGDYYYKAKTNPVKVGNITLVSDKQGKLIWKKYDKAVKYKINIQYWDEYSEYTKSTTFYLNDYITGLINEGKITKYFSYEMQISALDKDGFVIGTWYGDVRYLEPNTLAVGGKTIKAKRNKKKTFKAKKVFAFVNKGQGSLSYSKVSGSGKIKINKTNGTVTVKKGLKKKKKYKVTFKVSAAGKGIYGATERLVKVTVKIK